jgi:hypothetical protein
MPAPTEKTIATSLKLPASVKAQIDESAASAGMTAHAYMVRTLAKAAERARLRAQFDAETVQAWEEMRHDKLGYDFEDVRAYFAARAVARKTGAPMPPKPTLQPWREDVDA